MVRSSGVALVLVLLFGLAQGFLVEAQTAGIVRGRVISKTGTPVPRIKITIATKWGFTDSTGRYVLTRIPPGTYKVTLERGNKKVDNQEIEVKGPVTNVPDLKWPF